MTRHLVIGEQLSTPPWIPMRETADGECPQCGFEGSHPVMQDEDGDMIGQCRYCYINFTVHWKEEGGP
jgi:hypothetical protein